MSLQFSAQMKRKKKNPTAETKLIWNGHIVALFKTSRKLHFRLTQNVSFFWEHLITVQFMQRIHPVLQTMCHIPPHPERRSWAELRAESAHLMPMAVLTEKYFIKTFWQRAKEIVSQRNKLLQAWKWTAFIQWDFIGYIMEQLWFSSPFVGAEFAF